MNGCTFKGGNSVIFIFASLLGRGLLLREEVCFHRSKFVPSYVSLHFGRALSAGEANRKSQNSLSSGRVVSGRRRADVDATIYFRLIVCFGHMAVSGLGRRIE